MSRIWQGEEHVVELRRFVNNVAQSETPFHEDKPRHPASLTKRRQLDVPRQYVAILQQRFFFNAVFQKYR
jgi:hypothetical protein